MMAANTQQWRLFLGALAVASVSWHAFAQSRSTHGTAATYHRRALFPGGESPVQLGGVPHGLANANVETCAPCHAEIAREWQTSLHAQAWTDDVFLAAYNIEPMAFCRNCHAPRMTAGAREPDELAKREGVSCAVCHVRDGAVLGSGNHRTDGAAMTSTRARPLHREASLPSMSKSTFCAGCHQFNFPADPGGNGAVYDSHEPMQDTYREWQLSSYSVTNTECQDCHMPWKSTADGRRYRSHSFPGGRDQAMIARAVNLNVELETFSDRIVVHASVSANAVGHSFPTGDLFRRGEFTVWIDGQQDKARLVSFARVFADVPTRSPSGTLSFRRHQVADSRLAPPGMGTETKHTLTLDVPPALRGQNVRVRWSLDHLLMPTPLASAQGFSAPQNRMQVIEGSRIVVPPK